MCDRIGIIYRIYVDREGVSECYIGSTYKTIKARLTKHKCQYRYWKNGSYNKVMTFDLFEKYGVENCKIMELERINGGDIYQLRDRERFWISQFPTCINKVKNLHHGMTRREYGLMYYLQNVEKIRSYLSERIVCDCGKIIARGSMGYHLVSKGHLKTMEALLG